MNRIFEFLREKMVFLCGKVRFKRGKLTREREREKERKKERKKEKEKITREMLRKKLSTFNNTID